MSAECAYKSPGANEIARSIAQTEEKSHKFFAGGGDLPAFFHLRGFTSPHSAKKTRRPFGEKAAARKANRDRKAGTDKEEKDRDR